MQKIKFHVVAIWMVNSCYSNKNFRGVNTLNGKSDRFYRAKLPTENRQRESPEDGHMVNDDNSKSADQSSQQSISFVACGVTQTTLFAILLIVSKE